jgi:hypothetical protein
MVYSTFYNNQGAGMQLLNRRTAEINTVGDYENNGLTEGRSFYKLNIT